MSTKTDEIKSETNRKKSTTEIKRIRRKKPSENNENIDTTDNVFIKKENKKIPVDPNKIVRYHYRQSSSRTRLGYVSRLVSIEFSDTDEDGAPPIIVDDDHPNV